MDRLNKLKKLRQWGGRRRHHSTPNANGTEQDSTQPVEADLEKGSGVATKRPKSPAPYFGFEEEHSPGLSETRTKAQLEAEMAMLLDKFRSLQSNLVKSTLLAQENALEIKTLRQETFALEGKYRVRGYELEESKEYNGKANLALEEARKTIKDLEQMLEQANEASMLENGHATPPNHLEELSAPPDTTDQQMREACTLFRKKVVQAATWLIESERGPVKNILRSLEIKEVDQPLLCAPIANQLFSMVLLAFEKTLGIKMTHEINEPLSLPLVSAEKMSRVDKLLGFGTGAIASSVKEDFGALLRRMIYQRALSIFLADFWLSSECPNMLFFQGLLRECTDAFVPLVRGLPLGLVFREYELKSWEWRLCNSLQGLRESNLAESFFMFPEYLRFTENDGRGRTILRQCSMERVDGRPQVTYLGSERFDNNGHRVEEDPSQGSDLAVGLDSSVPK